MLKDAKTVWKDLIRNLRKGEYRYWYVQRGILLLADVSENLRALKHKKMIMLILFLHQH